MEHWYWGSSKHATFTFHYPTNLIVHSGGILHDKTIEHKIYVAQRTQWTIHSGALMIAFKILIYIVIHLYLLPPM